MVKNLQNGPRRNRPFQSLQDMLSVGT